MKKYLNMHVLLLSAHAKHSKSNGNYNIIFQALRHAHPHKIWFKKCNMMKAKLKL